MQLYRNSNINNNTLFRGGRTSMAGPVLAGPLFSNQVMIFKKSVTYISFKCAKVNGAAQNQKDTFCTKLDTLYNWDEPERAPH